METLANQYKALYDRLSSYGNFEMDRVIQNSLFNFWKEPVQEIEILTLYVRYQEYAGMMTAKGYCFMRIVPFSVYRTDPDFFDDYVGIPLKKVEVDREVIEIDDDATVELEVEVDEIDDDATVELEVMELDEEEVVEEYEPIAMRTRSKLAIV
jgi:hypothetical protein